MYSNFALGFLRIASSFLFYLMILITVGVIVAYVVEVNDPSNKGFTLFQYNVKGKELRDQPAVMGVDNLFQYKPVSDTYVVEVKAGSAQGIYALFGKLIFFCLAIAGLYQFSKIFEKTNIYYPFRTELLKRLKILSWLFITADLLRLIHYFLFNSLLRTSFPNERFQLLTEFGDGFINAFIIWVIIVVLKRGQQIQDEHALTV